MKKLKSLFFPTILALALGLMLSCAKSSEDNINDGVANTNENLEDTLEDNNDTAVDLENALNGGGGSNNQSQCTSGITFQKGIFGKQAKQTNDCGYIVAYNGKLTKLDERGETKWESEITLYQKKHSNLGKPSVIQTRDGGYLYSDNDGIAKVNSNGEIEWTNKKYRDFEDAIEHSNGYFYLVSDELVAHNSKAKVYKFNSKGK